jgi:hypothetical protein
MLDGSSRGNLVVDRLLLLALLLKGVSHDGWYTKCCVEKARFDAVCSMNGNFLLAFATATFETLQRGDISNRTSKILLLPHIPSLFEPTYTRICYLPLIDMASANREKWPGQQRIDLQSLAKVTMHALFVNERADEGLERRCH